MNAAVHHIFNHVKAYKIQTYMNRKMAVRGWLGVFGLLLFFALSVLALLEFDSDVLDFLVHRKGIQIKR